MNMKWKALLAVLALMLILCVPAFALYQGLTQFNVPASDVTISGTGTSTYDPATITCHHTSSNETYYVATPFLNETCSNAVMKCSSGGSNDRCVFYHVLGTVEGKEFMHRYINIHKDAAIQYDGDGNPYIDCRWQCALCGGKAYGASWAKDLIRHNCDGEYEYTKEATCTAPKQLRDYCANGCGYFDNKSEGEPNPEAHNWKDYIYNNDATCTQGGTMTAECFNNKYAHKNNPEAMGYSTIPDPDHPALNHQNVEEATRDASQDIAATCQAPAKLAYICSRTVNGVTCGQVFYVDDGETVPCNMVKDDEQSYDATCTRDGQTVTVCSYGCGETQTDPIDAKGHKSKPLHGFAATCTSNGLTSGSYCGRCNATLDAQYVIPATGHSSVTDAAVAPTCTETGLTEGSHCTVCGVTLVKQETVPAKGHSAAVDAAVAPTCTETGLTEGSHCSVCGVTLLAQQVVEPLGHDYRGKVTPPTCTEGGYTRYTCTRCDDSYKAKHTNAIGHWYGLWTDNGDSTHSAMCQRTDCGDVATADCQYLEITMNDQIKKICIVCDEILETAILNAVCESLDPQIGLPRGELIVRSIVENEMWMLSAAFEYAGTVQPFNAAVKVTISAEDLPENFKLMQVVVTEATETTERTEEWIEVDFTCTEETMSFVTDAAALYVLVPVE